MTRFGFHAALTLILITLVTGLFAQPVHDNNGDGVLNGMDIRAVVDVLLGEREVIPAHDVNGDGTVNSIDLVNLMNEFGSNPMIPVAESTFPMGNIWGSDTYGTELPVHDVTLSDYEIGRDLVTNTEYMHFLNTAHAAGEIEVRSGFVYPTGSHFRLIHTVIGQDQIVFSLANGFTLVDRGGVPLDDHPVIGVTWWGAAFHCNWLSRQHDLDEVYSQTGWWLADLSRSGYHLPTEAQWERAAAWDPEIQNKWRYAISSNSITTDQANFSNANPVNLPPFGVEKPGYALTSPVGHFSGFTSPVGCRDMNGNAAEWCHDWYRSDYYSNSPSVDPEGPPEGEPSYNDRVGRGNSWRGGASRTSGRYGMTRESPGSGFRLARSAIGDTTTIAIDVFPDEGSWTLAGPGGFSMTGAGDRLGRDAIRDLELGTYTLTCDDNVADHDPPAPINGTLEINHTLPFMAIYTPTGGVSAPDMATVLNEGWFHRGDLFDEGDADERPVRPITLSTFEIGRFEVTNDEYVAFLNSALAAGEITYVNGEVFLAENENDVLCDVYPQRSNGPIASTGVGFYLREQDGQFVGDHPVINVSWYGGAAYCNWLSRQHGLGEVYTESGDWPSDLSQNGYHLPTEAQWERAASWDAGETRHWRYGFSSDSINTEQANIYLGEVFSNPLNFTTHPFTSPVGYYTGSTSPVGCFDMTGNVAEMCNDWYGETYYTLSNPSTDPEGPASGEYRVFRGGAWSNNLHRYRTADRADFSPQVTLRYLGFRLARNP